MSDYLEDFDFDAFPSSDEYTFDFESLDRLSLIGEERQNPASYTDLLLPGVTAPPMEPEIDFALIDPSAVFPATLAPNLQLAQITNIEVPASFEAETPVKITPSGYDRSALASGECHALKKSTTEIHQDSSDVPDHRQIQTPVPFSCAECLHSFTRNSELESHGYQSKHGAYACSCGKSFARLDSLLRHERCFLKNGRLFPCTFCKRHRGEDGFRRRDHLIQHLNGYHKFPYHEIENILPLRRNAFYECQCIEPTCEFHRGEASEELQWWETGREAPMKRRTEYNKHLKEAHNATPYPCPIIECKQVGAKGYTTWDGLKKHLALKHKTSPKNLGLENTDKERNCDQCHKALPDLEDFNIHHQLLHRS